MALPQTNEFNTPGSNVSGSGFVNFLLAGLIFGTLGLWLMLGMHSCSELQSSKSSFIAILTGVLLLIVTPILLIVMCAVTMLITDLWATIVTRLKTALFWSAAGLIGLILICGILLNLQAILTCVAAILILIALIVNFVSFLSTLRITGISVSGVHMRIDDDET